MTCLRGVRVWAMSKEQVLELTGIHGRGLALAASHRHRCQ